MSERGIGVGFNARWQESGSAAPDGSLTSLAETTSEAEKRERAPGKSWGRFRSYIIDDQSPSLNKTAQAREGIENVRYRVSLQDRTYWTDDLYSTINLNILSDRRFLQDFEPGEFRENPNPDNAISLTKWSENYTLNITGRAQLNTDMDGTEKLPEGALDVKRQPVFGKSGIFYDSETSAGFLRRTYADGSLLPDYDAFRADTFHQLSLSRHLLWMAFARPQSRRARDLLLRQRLHRKCHRRPKCRDGPSSTPPPASPKSIPPPASPRRRPRPFRRPSSNCSSAARCSARW